jgi:transcriptional regulator with XRE-family HTH domain
MKKSPSAVDRYIGARVRARRVQIGVSQERLGDALGITFQQIQKYEKGANRMGASRLQQAATALGVPVSHFYDGAPDAQGMALAEAPQAAYTPAVTTEEAALLAAFRRVSDSTVRKRMLLLIEAMAAE